MGPRERRKKTPVWPASRRPTWFAPKSDPNGRQRLEAWDLFSRDGRWHYQREETSLRPVWRTIFVPTGQWREFASKDTAREETFAGLADELAREAFTLALRTPAAEDGERARGHRLLAIHMRVSGRTRGAECDQRCACGGWLAQVSRAGDLAHLDACERCYTPGQGLPQRRCRDHEQHRFCGRPRVPG
jgi:hypothetical protein